MNRILLLFIGISLTPLANPVCLQGETSPGTWTHLLSKNTQELSENWDTTGNWKLKDGVATLVPREGERGWQRWTAYLWSKQAYANFEVEFDYKLESRGNSGFYFRVGDKNDPVRQGIEVQIYDTDPKKPKKSLNDHDSGGIIPGLKPHDNRAKAAGEWNTMRVVNQADRIVVHLNGKQVNEYDLSKGGPLAERPGMGPIGFQDHGLPISLRNIRVREL